MVRVNRTELTRNEIIRCAANRFLENGYTATTIGSMCKAMNMSTGNMTFHFPTKEHLLTELVCLLGNFQRLLMEKEVAEGYSSMMAFCLELVTIAAACEEDEIAKDFFISAYSSPLSLEIIRKNHRDWAKEIFHAYCSGWTDERFAEAETFVSGIEYATLLTTSDSAPLEARITGALNTILMIYNVPEDVRRAKIAKVLAMDYRALSVRILKEFREYVDQTTEQALIDLFQKKKSV